ncbi:MAG: DUF3857 domain-containing protein [Oligoflexales bacterium]|nr:DUF3857 domain-containing protein [Oligoflexales bacterium]
MNVKRIILLFHILLSSNVLARWASFEEASSTFKLNAIYDIEENGTYNLTSTNEISINTESARQNFSSIYVSYNPEMTKIHLFDGEVQHKEGTFKFLPEYISDKPLADDGSGFDNIHRMMVALPKVNVGSVIVLHTKEENYTVAFPKYFSWTFNANDPTVKDSKILFRSKIPLKIGTKNTEGLFEIKESKSDQIYVIEIKALRSIYFKSVEEELGSYPSKQIPEITISSAADYSEIYQDYAKQYEEKIGQAIPEEFSDILKKAKEKTLFTDQVNFIMAELADKVVYRGDWRTIKGKLVLRDLKEIARTGFGDCKDYAGLTVALLRQLGYANTQVAIVKRRLGPVISALLPISEFDHAIVHASVNGQSYWLDPTNPTAFSGVREDILNRRSVVLHPHKVFAETIPLPTINDNSVVLREEVTLLSGNLVRLKMSGELNGLASVEFRERNFYTSKEQFQYDRLKKMTGGHHITTVHQQDLPLVQDRMPSSYKWSADLNYEHPILKTSLGDGFLREGTWALKRIDPDTYVNGVYFGDPLDLKKILVVKAKRLRGKDSSCSAQSRWVTMQRSINYQKSSVTIEDHIVQKVYAITNDELKSAEFKNFLKELRDCYCDYVVVY